MFKGYRTLDDLRKSGKLTRVQLIGLKHYDDLVERMPRSEAAEIEDKVSSFVSWFTHTTPVHNLSFDDKELCCDM